MIDTRRGAQARAQARARQGWWRLRLALPHDSEFPCAAMPSPKPAGALGTCLTVPAVDGAEAEAGAPARPLADFSAWHSALRCSASALLRAMRAFCSSVGTAPSTGTLASGFATWPWAGAGAPAPVGSEPTAFCLSTRPRRPMSSVRVKCLRIFG
jgi:hypothetical protein